MKTAFIPLLLLLLAGCCQTSEADNKRTFELLQGNWYCKVPEGEIRPPEPYLSFSFQDSICTSSDSDSPMQFSVNEKQLYSDVINKDGRKTRKIWKIIMLNTSVLKMVKEDEITKRMMINGAGEKDRRNVLTLYRIKKKNTINPESISFFSTSCNGPCPSFAIEIQSTGDFKYFGHFQGKSGRYRGRTSVSEYEKLLKLIHDLPLNTMKENYSATWTCDQACYLSLKYDGKWKEVSVYGNDQEPVELRILLDHIITTAPGLTMKRDEKLNTSEFRTYGSMGFPVESPQ